MKIGYTKKVNFMIGFAFLAGPFLMALMIIFPAALQHIWLIAILALAAQILLIVGCCYYASGKGYHPALGLLGLFSIPGLIVLAFFPDKHKGEDANSGCLSTVVYLLLALALIFGPIFFFLKNLKKNQTVVGGSSQLDKLNDSIMKLNVTLITSSYSDLGSRVKAMDELMKAGGPGIAQLKIVYANLKSKPNPTKDDQILTEQIANNLAALPKTTSSDQTAK